MKEKKKILFIVNPKSGRGQIRTKLLDILNTFTAAGYDVQVHVTQAPEDATKTAAERGKHYDLMVCSGGDGTLNEVISGLMKLEHPPCVGYIPAGSTNDFAASLNMPKNMVQAAENILTGNVKMIDVGSFCKEKYFLYVAGFGAFTEVSYLTSQEQKNLLGHQAYIFEGAKSLSAIKPYFMKIETDTEKIEGNFIFGIVTNATRVGGFRTLIAENVDLSDGLFEVLLIRYPESTAQISEILSGIFMKENNAMIYRTVTSSFRAVSVEAVDWVIDGEYGGRHHEVEIQNLSKRIAMKLSDSKKNTYRNRKNNEKNVEF